MTVLKISLCTDKNTKYTGCHLEQIAAAWDHARDLTKCETLATKQSTTATIHAMATGRRLLPPVAGHSKRNTLLSRVRSSTHAKHVTAMADAARTPRNGSAPKTGLRQLQCPCGISKLVRSRPKHTVALSFSRRRRALLLRHATKPELGGLSTFLNCSVLDLALLAVWLHV